jgi:hypothetical protein
MSVFQGLLDLVAEAMLRGGARWEHLECNLKSGRIFRYQFHEYPFGPDTTPEQADALARKVVADKYKNCQWDRAHPHVDSEEDIVSTITAFILGWSARMNRVRTSQQPRASTPSNEASES